MHSKAKNRVVKVLNQVGNGVPQQQKSNVGKSHASSKDASAKDWRDLEDLAKSTYTLLMSTETSLLNTEHQRTENYWHLGDYLTQLRRKLGLAHGSWQKYLEQTLHIDYQRAKRACRLKKKYEKCEGCKGKTLKEAMNYNPSPTVKEAKQAQAKAKRGGKTKVGQPGGSKLPTPSVEQKPPTDEEKQALKIFLEACGSIERARFVLEAVAHA
jgi:hypothetical protein